MCTVVRLWCIRRPASALAGFRDVSIDGWSASSGAVGGVVTVSGTLDLGFTIRAVAAKVR